MVAIFAAVCFSLGFFAACGESGSGDNGGTGGGDNPSGHTHSYVETVISPTCTEKGYTLHKCACGYEFLDNLTAALGHNLGEWKETTPATEGKDGEETRACTRENCDYTETRKIPAQEHTHDYKETIVEPTCTEKGYTLHKCACGDEYKDNETEALGHSFTNYVSDGNATCTKDGTKTAKCDRCDEEDTVTDEKTALGHNFGEWKEIKPATEEEDGLKTRSCARCGETEEQSIPAKTHEHKYVETVIEPTCTEKGYTLHKCACGEVYKDNEQPALGHSFTNYVSDGNATCTKDGTKTAKCDRCDETKTITDEKTALGHNFSTEWTVDKEATCTEKGIKSHHCTRCNAKTDETAIPIIDHNYVDGVCTICGNEEMEVAIGLEYELSNDKTYYIVKGIGIEKRLEFKIPELYNGKPVKEVGKYAFHNCKSIVRVKIPDSIFIIGKSAFAGCSSLKQIVLPNYIEELGSGVFSGCDGLEYNKFDNGLYVGNSKKPYMVLVKAVDITITKCIINESCNFIHYAAFYGCCALKEAKMPNGIIKIEDASFSGCSSLENIILNNGLLKIGDSAFYDCIKLKKVIIPDSVEIIGNYAFGNCSNLSTMVIGKGVITVGDDVLSGFCNNFEEIFYNGSSEKWSQISIGKSNGTLLSANRYFYSKDKPLDEGNYWYYDENENIRIW